MGVRISWLMLARNCVLALGASYGAPGAAWRTAGVPRVYQGHTVHGVRISWLMLARNCVLAREAFSATALASSSSA